MTAGPRAGVAELPERPDGVEARVGVRILRRGEERLDRRRVRQLSEHEHEVAADRHVVGPRRRERPEDPQRLGREGVALGRRPGSGATATARTPPASAGSPCRPAPPGGSRPAIAARTSCGRRSRRPRRPSRRRGAAGGRIGTPCRGRSRRGLLVRGGRALARRIFGHRTGRYRLACVIGLGTKIASFSQTVSQRRHETQGPASTSAILWNVS